MRRVFALLIVLFSIIAVGTSFALGIFTATTCNIAETAETAGAASVTEALSGNVIPEPTPLPTLSLHTRWYLSGDIAQGIGCRVMYSEPKNGSYIFVPYRGEIIWIAYNSSGWHSAGNWTGHIKRFPATQECIVSIGVFDNKTKTFISYGSTIIGAIKGGGYEQNFTIRTGAIFVGEDQYLAFRVYNPSYWLKINTCNGACYIDKPCDIRIEDDDAFAGMYESRVKRFNGSDVFVQGGGDFTGMYEGKVRRFEGKVVFVRGGAS